ncbi:HAMP domain-containing histidine kinase [Sulfurimonas sp. MAG313]|nr:HAMP domain-containing sensor histidine kinase [Sulfurimonas sp. MAG313]MDF1880789.1 HAMP domain-containing histidine kinase [Sulfurimonas sp. MAG313]
MFSYEKSSFYRFFFIYTIVFLLLFSALASLYYYKESKRYFQEKKTSHKITYLECVRLHEMLKDTHECQMQAIDIRQKIKTIYEEIFIALLLTLVITLPLGYFLARLSLKPMRDSVERMDGFINGIIHDINTPLSVIKINAQSMSKRIQDPKLQEKSERIIQGVDQIEALEEMLLFSLKLDSYALSISRFDLADELQKRLHFYKAIRSNITLSLQSEICFINADCAALMRLVDNIVSNAMKYSRSNSKVNIQLKGKILLVEDFGIGIKRPKEVFQKYYREAENIQGIGIGLYIVAQIAKMHKLEIKVESEVNKGTRFYFSVENLS